MTQATGGERAAMVRNYRRKKSIRVTFVLQFYTGLSAYGYTQHLSGDSATVQCSALATPGLVPPKPGDMAVLLLNLGEGTRVEGVRVSSRILQIEGNTIRLQLMTGSMVARHRELFMQLLGA